MKIYFKHSTQCPISARAKREVDRFLENKPGDIEFELVDVLSNRTRSNEIAQQLGVQHESPQVIITDSANKVLWSASHRGITEESIQQALRYEIPGE